MMNQFEYSAKFIRFDDIHNKGGIAHSKPNLESGEESMLVVAAQLCMAINLYKECRGASDKECQLINLVVINRMQETHKDACSVIFEKNQFSWTNQTPKKLNFNNYNQMVNYYTLTDSTQLVRAFNNVSKSSPINNTLKVSNNMTHYYDTSINQPKWADKMQVAYRTKNFVFYNNA